MLAPGQHAPSMGKRAAPDPVQRYRWLVESLGAEFGRGHGWKKRVAGRLGVHPSYISKVLSGSLSGIGVEVLDRAVDELNLVDEFFFDPAIDLTGKTWRDFARVHVDEPAADEGAPVRFGWDAAAVGGRWAEIMEAVPVIFASASRREPVPPELALRVAQSVLELPFVRTALSIVTGDPGSRSHRGPRLAADLIEASEAIGSYFVALEKGDDATPDEDEDA